MSRFQEHAVLLWSRVGTRFLPFADTATTELPMKRLLRLALFQVSVGVAMVLLVGTLNRVMIVELRVPAWLVSVMVAVPLVIAPFRALIGHRSDQHRSAFGWRRVPYIWFGTLAQFGGLAIMPFALIILSGDTHAGPALGYVAASVAFLLVGGGLQVTQTAGLALATDLAPEAVRPKVVALMYSMLLVGMVAAGLVFGLLLASFSQLRLIQVIQGAAVLTIALNVVALWKQEPRDLARGEAPPACAAFADSWRAYLAQPGALRFLVTVGLGTAAFNMQDIVLEPYGGEVLHLGVGSTTRLTALLAGGMLAAFAYAGRELGRGRDSFRVAGQGVLAGFLGFPAVAIAAPVGSVLLFQAGVALNGFGAGLFAAGTLAGAMDRETHGDGGLALGAWGAVQATAAGIAIALGGVTRDVVAALAATGSPGSTLSGPAVGYSVVYLTEFLLLFITLAAIGPLVRATVGAKSTTPATTFNAFSARPAGM
jgi:BCD family chlorophyll transporter-like MFS transporter